MTNSIMCKKIYFELTELFELNEFELPEVGSIAFENFVIFSMEKIYILLKNSKPVKKLSMNIQCPYFDWLIQFNSNE